MKKGGKPHPNSLRNLKRGQPGPGRPRGSGMAAKIQKAMSEGQELVDFWLGLFRDKSARLPYRMQAAEWLGDRGWGRPTQSLEHAGVEGRPVEVTVVWPDN